MSDQRYAPPAAPLVHETPSDAGAEFSVKRALEDGWRLTWANFGLLLGTYTVFGLLLVASILTGIGAILLAPVLLFGVTRFNLRIIDGGARFADLWDGFSDYGRALGGMLGVQAASLAIGLVGQIPSGIGRATGNLLLVNFGGVLNAAFQLFVGSRLLFASYYVVDQALGPIEALQRSWDETSHLKLRSAGLVIAIPLVIFAGLLALFVGIIPAAMIAQLAIVSAYRQRVPRARSAAA